MNNTVSIILPCYNVAPYLDACLDSLVNQTLQDIEIICVNDGSTDGTLAVLQSWERKDRRIRVINQENGGLSAARNAGMDLAQGEYIGFVDPDDYVEHFMYERLLETARSSRADVAACGYVAFSDGDGTIMEEWSRSPAAGVEECVRESVFHSDSVWCRMESIACNKLYLRSFLEKCALKFVPSFRKGEDDVFWLMLLPHIDRLAVIPDRLYWYRKQREGAISYQWEICGCPYDLDMERLEYVTAYWRNISWQESALSRGWMAYLLKRFLLAHVSSAEEIFRVLDDCSRKELVKRYREWFAVSGLSPEFKGLRSWDQKFCRLLDGRGPAKLAFHRLIYRLMGFCSGRRGRYYRLKLYLSCCL